MGSEILRYRRRRSSARPLRDLRFALLERLLRRHLRHHSHPVDDESPIKMIELMLPDARLVSRSLLVDLLTLQILRPDANRFVTDDRRVDPRQAQTSFLFFLTSLGLRKLR